MIEFINVSKKFKDDTIIENLSMKIAKEAITVFLGPSGCGKTTTLKMINKLILPSSGKIMINGEDISNKDVIALRRNIGYVIQQTGLFPHFTIKENIEVIPKLAKMNIKKIEEKTKELMQMTGLDYEFFKDKYPAQLSGGQQQRIGVARAFATDPDIILMDEPFSAVDPINRAQLQKELVKLQKTFHKTIVFVTHDIKEAIKIADKICIMKDGKIAQYDTPENIVNNPADEFIKNFMGL